MNKIAVIGSVGLPAMYGGFETLVENLIKADGEKFSVYCSSRVYKEKLNSYFGAELIYIPIKPNGVQAIFYDIFSIVHAVLNGSKKLLVLGSSGSLIFPLIKFFFPKVQIITNIDGLEWYRSKWNKGLKKLFIKYIIKIAIKYSDKIVSDNQAIADYLLLSFNQDSIVIPYGGDHALIQQTQNNDKNYFLGLCRIEPENNISIILQAFAENSQNLIFIGNWDYSDYGKDMRESFKNYKNIKLMDPEYDPEVLFNIRANCTSYIHGHSAGGTNPSLVEMMHFGKDIIAFDCEFNRATLENEGYYFHDVNSLKSLTNKSNHNLHGKKILEIAKRRYTWDIVNKQYFDLFR